MLFVFGVLVLTFKENGAHEALYKLKLLHVKLSQFVSCQLVYCTKTVEAAEESEQYFETVSASTCGNGPMRGLSELGR